jgi:hypothetical protein
MSLPDDSFVTDYPEAPCEPAATGVASDPGR